MWQKRPVWCPCQCSCRQTTCRRRWPRLDPSAGRPWCFLCVHHVCVCVHVCAHYVCMWVHACVCVCVCVCKHAHRHTGTQMSYILSMGMSENLSIDSSISIYIHKCVCIHIYLSISIYIYKCICIYIYLHTCTYTNLARRLTATPRETSETASMQQSSSPKIDLATSFPMEGGEGAVADTGVSLHTPHRQRSTVQDSGPCMAGRDLYLHIHVCVCVCVCVCRH